MTANRLRTDAICARGPSKVENAPLSCALFGDVFSFRMPWDFWLIFFVLGVVLPWRGYTRLQVLLAKPKVDSRERLSLYAFTIAFQWVAAGIVAWRAWAH